MQWQLQSTLSNAFIHCPHYRLDMSANSVMNNNNNNSKRVNTDKMMYGQSMSQSPKKHDMDIDLSHTQLNQSQSQQASPLSATSTALIGGIPSRRKYL